jgi:hypothetical protein
VPAALTQQRTQVVDTPEAVDTRAAAVTPEAVMAAAVTAKSTSS